MSMHKNWLLIGWACTEIGYSLQIRKKEAERTLFIPQIGQIKARWSLFIPQILKNELKRSLFIPEIRKI